VELAFPACQLLVIGAAFASDAGGAYIDFDKVLEAADLADL